MCLAHEQSLSVWNEFQVYLLVESKLLVAFNFIVTSHGHGRPAPVARLVDPLSSIFFINRFNPLSDHGLVGNSSRKCFAPSRFVSFKNFITTLS